jgi:hypothetical protein
MKQFVLALSLLLFNTFGTKAQTGVQDNKAPVIGAPGEYHEESKDHTSKPGFLYKEPFYYAFVNYSGLLASYKNIPNGANQSPMGVYGGMTVHYSFFSWEARTGYMTTLVYDYPVETSSSSSTNYYVLGSTARLQRKGVSLGLSAGINLPLKNAVIYALYGGDIIMFTTTNNMVTPRYTLVKPPVYPFFNSHITFGTSLRIPHSHLGASVQYNLHSISSKRAHPGELTDVEKPNRLFYISHTSEDHYKYTNAGISICWFFEKSR